MRQLFIPPLGFPRASAGRDLSLLSRVRSSPLVYDRAIAGLRGNSLMPIFHLLSVDWNLVFGVRSSPLIQDRAIAGCEETFVIAIPIFQMWIGT
jgi:hypothetical protein